MEEKVNHNCGICVAYTLHDTYSILKSLQHRGRDAAGIAALGGEIDVLKWRGRVQDFGLEDLNKIFPSNKYFAYMGHIRYATKGKDQDILDYAHPHTIGGELIDNHSHIFINNADAVIVHNGQVDSKYTHPFENSCKTDCDSEALLHFIDSYGEVKLLQNIPGAYTLAYYKKGEPSIKIARDPSGMRPGYLGFKDGKHMVASEDVAIRKNGAKIIEGLDPGAVYYLDNFGRYTVKNISKGKNKFCFFEWNYILDRDSIFQGVPVRNIRKQLGKELAEEFTEDIDFVTYVPRCPEDAARSYAKKRGVPFLPVFYKMTKERSFLGPSQKKREKSIGKNLFLIPNIEEKIKGKKIVVIDDSIVRGTVSNYMGNLLKDAGVSKAYLLSYTAQIGVETYDRVKHGCYFGVDMPPEEENFIARGRTVDEISEKVGLEVYYLSKEGMQRAFSKSGIPASDLCTFCTDGPHPYTNYEIEPLI